MTTDGKCLIITTHYRPLFGGAQAVYDALARARPDAISVLTGASDIGTGARVEGVEAFDAESPYEIRRLPLMRLPIFHGKPSLWARFHAFWVDRALRRDVRQASVRMVVETGARAVCIGSLDGLGWLVAPLKRRLGLPVLLFVHGEEVSQAAYAARAEAARRKALLAADAVIAVSRFTARVLADRYGVPKSRIHVLTNGVDYARFSTPAGTDIRGTLGLGPGLGTGPLVLSLGRLVRRKGFDRLLDAWPQVKAAVPGATLLIAGDGPLKAELEARAAALGPEAGIRLLGRVADADLPGLMQAADLFAMPNRTLEDGDTEGFGLVFLEAAAAGVPSVAGNAGGAPDAVKDRGTGLLVNGDDPDAIAQAVIRLLQDDALRAKYAAAARAHAAREDWPHKAQAFLSLCENLYAAPHD